MNKSKVKSLLTAIREMLTPRKAAGLLLILGLPLDARKLPFLEGIPDGLRLLHVAGSVPEAELLTQTLIQEGFHIEYVSPTATGIYGMTGNNMIYAAAADYKKAAQFLRDYLNSSPEPDGAAGNE